MPRLERPSTKGLARGIGAWGMAVLIAGAVFGGIVLRQAADESARASATPAASPSMEVVSAAVGAGDRSDLRSARYVGLPPVPTPTPKPTPAPTPVPTPIVVAAPPAPAAPPPADDGNGGGFVPGRTPPPGWVPPTSQPGDVLVSGAFGQTLSAEGINVTAVRLSSPTPQQALCEMGTGGTPEGYGWSGFRLTTVWSGLSTSVHSASSPSGHPEFGACWDGAEHWESGHGHEVWMLVKSGTEATTPLIVGYFPNGASPMIQFTFH